MRPSSRSIGSVNRKYNLSFVNIMMVLLDIHVPTDQVDYLQVDYLQVDYLQVIMLLATGLKTSAYMMMMLHKTLRV
jgi:hypothetical protein